MLTGLSIFFVGAVLCLNGLWLLSRVQDREIWVINLFVAAVSFFVALPPGSW
nr:AmiS/UreI family transporter [Cephaloticoccus primus]